MWFLRTLYLQARYFLALSTWEKKEYFKFLLIMCLIFLGYERKEISSTNTFYNLWDLVNFGTSLKEAIKFHNKMARVILDPKHKGIKAWEYGMLFSHLKFKKGMKILDLGSGGSALPFYLATKGVKITAFDLKNPIEKPLLLSHPNLIYRYGTMTKLPFKTSGFDLILCISAIEHLDYLPDKRRQVSYQKFLGDVKRSLSEMVRVVKKRGGIFITSDVYFPKLQRNDRFSQAYLYKGIGSAFKAQDFKKTFVDYLSELGCKLIGGADFNFDLVHSNINRSNYRGRFFTTFSLYVQKT